MINGKRDRAIAPVMSSKGENPPNRVKGLSILTQACDPKAELSLRYAIFQYR